MALRRTLGPVALAGLVVALLSPFSPAKLPSAGADDGVSSAGRSLFLQVRGTVNRKEGSPPERFVYEPGVHADRDTLQGDKSTGAYAGRAGRLRMSGWHDANKFPQTVTFNDFYEITLNP